MKRTWLQVGHTIKTGLCSHLDELTAASTVLEGLQTSASQNKQKLCLKAVLFGISHRIGHC